jgi:phenylacetate-CoA ligase
MVTSEMLFESDKKLLEKQFGIPIVNEYGASELDLIAFQNTNNEWQVNAETLFVEILDQNNQPVPKGTEGKIVVTSLYNKAHPFIRYEIGDVGILDPKITLQKPILQKLIGRTSDVAVLPSGKKSPGLTFYYVTKSIIEDDGNVKEFIVRQTKIDSFEIDYVSTEVLTKQQIDAIEKAIATYLEPGLQFTYTRKEVLDRTKRGKLKQFQSLL